MVILYQLYQLEFDQLKYTNFLNNGRNKRRHETADLSLYHVDEHVHIHESASLSSMLAIVRLQTCESLSLSQYSAVPQSTLPGIF